MTKPTALETAKRLELEMTKKPTQLELWEQQTWSEKKRGMSKTLARSALFAVIDKRPKERRRFTNEAIRTLNDVTIRYTGDQLDQDDHLVFMQLCHLAKSGQLGAVVSITGITALEGLGWGVSSISYTRLRESYRRLLEGTIYVYTDKGKLIYGSHILQSLKGGDDLADTDTPDTEWTIKLNVDMANLLTGDEVTLLDWVRHMKLSGLAKWLHAFYSTYETPLPYKTETLYEFCGSKIGEQRIFRSRLKKALDSLIPEFLDSYTIGPRPSYLVTVKKKRDAKVIEAA
jgi:hypothetical protein